MIGPVAAGKTTLGRALARELDLPFVDLDAEYVPDPPSDADWVVQHDALVARDRWLIAGDYRAVAPARFARAELVVWLDPPRWWCATRAIRRHRRGGAPLLVLLRWIRRYRSHGRLETERNLAAVPLVPVLRYRAARNVSAPDIVAAAPGAQ